MQSGELIITGNDQVVIHLRSFPSQVNVDFKHPLLTVPCNSQHEDNLQSEVRVSDTDPSKFILIISWSVTGVREIKWSVFY